MRPPTPPLSLSDGQRETLQALARSSTATHREVLRARALLLAADGAANTAIAGQVGVAPSTIKAWPTPPDRPRRTGTHPVDGGYVFILVYG